MPSRSEIKISDLRTFWGDLRDDSDGQKKFRAFIDDESLPLSILESWINEAKEKGYHKEFQDLLTVLGKKLGLDKEFGYYSSRPGVIPFDGLWKPQKEEESGPYIVIEVKSGTGFTVNVNQLGKYIEELSASRKYPQDRVFGLYIIGETIEENNEFEVLANQIRGSPYYNKIRLISYEYLIRLIRIKEEAKLNPEQTLRLLLPIDAINVGEIIEIIEDIICERRIGDETPKPPSPPERPLTDKDLPYITREELERLEDGVLILCPSQPDGVQFLLENNAWGFVRPRRKPDYFALYVSAPHSAIKYFGEVEKIIDPKDPESPVKNPEEYEGYEESKKLILMKKNSLRKLEYEIKLGRNRNKVPYKLRYYTLSSFRKANSLDDL